MKKISLLFLFIITGTLAAKSQCTPGVYDNSNHGYIHPDSTQFPHACQNLPFSSEIQIQVSQDTFGTFNAPAPLGPTLGTFAFDTIFITSVTTNPPLPGGANINYTCNPAVCYFLGASTGCINVSVPASATVHAATYRILVNVTAKGTFTPQAFPVPIPGLTQTQLVDWYKIIVDSTGTGVCLSGIPDNFDFKSFEIFEIQPNPTNSSFLINWYSPRACSGNLSITDMVGRRVYSEAVVQRNGVNNKKVDASGWSNGVYLLNLECNGKTQTRKIIVSK